jgi:hypothetical protein
MYRDLVFDRSGKAYAKAAPLTAKQQEERAWRDRTYWQWVDAKFAGKFHGSLSEFREALALGTFKV